MDNWESLHKSRFRAYQHHMEQVKERYWVDSIRNTVEHFKHHITQQVEQELARFSEALQVIAADIVRSGAHDITPDEKASVSMLVKSFTRPLQRKYCLVDPVNERPRVSDANPDVEIISIPDDSPPPSPMSLSQLHPWSIDESQLKEESPLQPGAEQERSLSPLPDLGRGNSKTATPERQLERSRDKRSREPTEAGPSRQNKRPRHGVSNMASEYIEDEPTERGSIHYSKVDGLDFIFQHEHFPGCWFVVRCDRDTERGGYIHRFKRHPLKFKRALTHFQQKKAKEKCHEEDVAGTYNDEEIVRKFGYRVYGHDLSDEWVERSNEKVMAGISNTKGPDSPSRTRSQARTIKGKRKVVAKNKGKGVAKASSATAAGPSNTNNNASSSRPARPNPELGPARRYPPISTSSPGPSRPNTTARQGNVPVADMGGGILSLERRTSTRPFSRNCRNEGSTSGQGRLRSSNQSREDDDRIWNFGDDIDDDPNDPASAQVVSDLIEANLTTRN